MFAEVVWGKFMRCGRGIGRTESCRKYVSRAPVEPEGMARRVRVPKKVVEDQEPICGFIEGWL